MRLMIDTNVLLDVVQGREPFASDSGAVLELAVTGQHAAYVPAHGLTTLYYLLRKHADSNVAIDTVDWVLSHFVIAPATQETFNRAREIALKDFEDSVVAAMAESTHSDYIITRNAVDFGEFTVPAVAPDAFLQIIRQ